MVTINFSYTFYTLNVVWLLIDPKFPLLNIQKLEIYESLTSKVPLKAKKIHNLGNYWILLKIAERTCILKIDLKEQTLWKIDSWSTRCVENGIW